MRLRRHLQRAVRARKLCGGVRGGRRARPVRGLRVGAWPALLRPAAQRGHGHAGARRQRSARARSTASCRSTPARRCAGEWLQKKAIERILASELSGRWGNAYSIYVRKRFAAGRGQCGDGGQRRLLPEDQRGRPSIAGGPMYLKAHSSGDLDGDGLADNVVIRHGMRRRRDAHRAIPSRQPARRRLRPGQRQADAQAVHDREGMGRGHTAADRR